MSSLERLFLYDASFMSGELPPSAAGVTNLVELRIGDNKMSGTLPESYSVLRWGSQLSMEICCGECRQAATPTRRAVPIRALFTCTLVPHAKAPCCPATNATCRVKSAILRH
jgi:hypothetical protein